MDLNALKKEILDEVKTFIQGHLHKGINDFQIDYNDLLNAQGNYATGSGSRTTGDGTGTQEISVNFEPKLIKITAQADNGDGSQSFGNASAVDDERCLFLYPSGGNRVSGIETSAIIKIYNDGGGSNTIADLSAVGNSSFTLNWSSVALDVDYIYEVWG